MTAARALLLDAARDALARASWSAVRMADVAATARVSRQTLYNEFGSKDGLARALVHREVDGYLVGVDRVLTGPGDPSARLPALAEWLVTTARGNPLVRSALTGQWGPRLPARALAAAPSDPAAPPAPRPGNGPVPSPGALLALVRDRAVTALAPPAVDPVHRAALTRATEVALRLALSCVYAPPTARTAADLVREALGDRAQCAEPDS
ncbi:TetR/AcrR family transcriptional regulator [Streptomyces sp. NPDC127068]|uniref:TetR/AcrR family transcriptional regulator n=1 Tax=Streptomyces sp. NPDC127068 TaxID=3347127 RepID=UPI00365DE5C9